MIELGLILVTGRDRLPAFSGHFGWAPRIEALILLQA